MSRVKRKYQVVFICEGRNYFRMVLPDREIRFQLIPNRLYYFNAIDWENTVLFFNMVTDNMEVFMWQEYKGAREARRSMHLLGYSSKRDLGNMVRSNMIANFPVTFQD